MKKKSLMTVDDGSDPQIEHAIIFLSICYINKCMWTWRNYVTYNLNDNGCSNMKTELLPTDVGVIRKKNNLQTKINCTNCIKLRELNFNVSRCI